MADKATFTLCILWEGELREAAKLLQAANDMDPESDGAQRAVQEAWAACSVALHGLTPEKSVVMLANDAIRKHKD